jgi:hypothetical protein
MHFGQEIELLPHDRMAAWAISLAKGYKSAAPFPHVVIDNFLDPDVFETLRGQFPGPDADIWCKFRTGRENLKLQSQDYRALPWGFKLLTSEAAGPGFVRFLQDLTGIDNLIPDPHLHGGGLHQTLPGGHLGMHIDYNYHPDWKLDRRLNAILYFNDDWDDAWGGDLELWDKEVKACIQKISPVPNRLVVFSTSEISWHGHPAPLTTPAGTTRKSVALYYYSNGRPDSEKGEVHNTVFKERPGEQFKPTARDILRGLVPPLVMKLLRKWKSGGDA